MEDRIINASILIREPKIGFAANNIIKGVEWEENKNSLMFGKIFELSIMAYEKDSSGFNLVLLDEKLNSVKEYKLKLIDLPDAQGASEKKGVEAHIKVPMSDPYILDNVEIWVEHSAQFDGSSNISSYVKKNNGISNLQKKIDFIEFDFASVISYKSGIYAYTLNFNIYGMAKKIRNQKSVKSFGVKPNIVLNSNELVQIDTTINGVPIGEYNANQIINRYKNGRATISCGVFIDNVPRYKVGEIAKVYGFNGKSVSKNRDGTDKRFLITSAELRYNGQLKQNLEMVEVK